jgi:DNA-binding MarR family transcriptional regulator
MTRLVDRIESPGYVARKRSPDDRRGVYVTITPAGTAKYRAVWHDHQLSIEQHFGRHIDTDEAAVIRESMERVLENRGIGLSG